MRTLSLSLSVSPLSPLKKEESERGRKVGGLYGSSWWSLGLFLRSSAMAKLGLEGMTSRLALPFFRVLCHP